MSCKKRIRFQKAKICTKDLDKRITLEYPFNIGTSNFDINTDRSFKKIGDFWAAIKTTAGSQFFDEVNLQEGITTDFYIRFTKSVDLSRTIWVIYNNRRFKIVNPENINEDNLWIKLRAVERGTVLKEANKI
jgi:SPP1 family predicted phage head-tail adaptor